jgi:hypothetical protein
MFQPFAILISDIIVYAEASVEHGIEQNEHIGTVMHMLCIYKSLWTEQANWRKMWINF